MGRMRVAVRSLVISDPTLSALVGTRVYPDRIPQTGMLPCITYAVVTDTPGINLRSQDGTADARIQFDCFASDPGTCDLLALGLFNALGGYSGTHQGVEIFRIKKDSERDLSDLEGAGGDEARYRVSCDYIIRYRTPIPTFS